MLLRRVWQLLRLTSKPCFLLFLDYHLNNRKQWRTTCLVLVASFIDADTLEYHPTTIIWMREWDRDRWVGLIVLFFFFALSHHSPMPCKRRIWSGIMWFSKWNYELVKSFFFFFFFFFLVSVVDGSAREDTRSLSLINNSVNEQIVWHSFIYLDLYSRVRKREREIKRINALILQNEYTWCRKKTIWRFCW